MIKYSYLTLSVSILYLYLDGVLFGRFFDFLSKDVLFSFVHHTDGYYCITLRHEHLIPAYKDFSQTSKG